MDNPFDQGQSARMSGEPRESNPYSTEVPRELWIKGYDAGPSTLIPKNPHETIDRLEADNKQLRELLKFPRDQIDRFGGMTIDNTAIKTWRSKVGAALSDGDSNE